MVASVDGSCGLSGGGMGPVSPAASCGPSRVGQGRGEMSRTPPDQASAVSRRSCRRRERRDPAVPCQLRGVRRRLRWTSKIPTIAAMTRITAIPIVVQLSIGLLLFTRSAIGDSFWAARWMRRQEPTLPSRSIGTANDAAAASTTPPVALSSDVYVLVIRREAHDDLMATL